MLLTSRESSEAGLLSVLLLRLFSELLLSPCFVCSRRRLVRECECDPSLSREGGRLVGEREDHRKSEEVSH